MAAGNLTDEAWRDLIAKIQAYIYPRRVRIREFFLDFDPLRSGRCTKAHFTRCLDKIGINQLSEPQVFGLACWYDESAQPASMLTPRQQLGKTINYGRFCQDVDQVFSCDAAMGTTSSSGHLPRMVQEDDEGHLLNILQRIGMLCNTRGVMLKHCFSDFERGANATTARLNPRMAGKVTRPQFARLFPFQKELGDKDFQFLEEQYLVETGDVHFQALVNDVEKVALMSSGMDSSVEEAPFARSDLVLKPDDAEWSHNHLSPLEKLRSKVVEKRVRLYGHFQDFDALRKGHCTIGQVKTVFTILNIGRELDRAEFDEMASGYTRADGMFCYREFCADVHKDFAIPLEKDPLAAFTMPDATTASPVRRNRIALTSARQTQVDALEGKIMSKIRTRGILVRPALQDMDKTKRGHVTRSQFARVMHQLGFDLSEAEVGRLCAVYCDLGNHNDFNYADFVRSVDPVTQARGWNHSHASPRESAYFDFRGDVRPLVMA